MNELYKEYLESINVISELDFLEVVNSFSNCIDNINLNEVIWSDYTDINKEDLAEDIINEILKNWNYVYVKSIDWNNKTFCLDDCDSIEDLEEINDNFKHSGWTIRNYKELSEKLKERENEDFVNKIKIKCRCLIDTLSQEEISEILNIYGKSRQNIN